VTLQTASGRAGRDDTSTSRSPDDLARVLEGLMGLAALPGHLRSRAGPEDPALRRARVCYNHLAGEVGIQLLESLVQRRYLAVGDDGLGLSDAGCGFVNDLGIDLGHLAARKTPLCRECLDRSERRSHLAGSLGRALLSRFEDMGWARREPGTRIVGFSPQGAAAVARAFPLDTRAP